MNAPRLSPVAMLAGCLLCLSFTGALGACTEAGLQTVPPPGPPKVDNLLHITGEFCTQPAEEVVFPVKVLFLLDQSASLQCTDSQNRRFQALTQTIGQLTANPNAYVGFVGFSSWSRVLNFTRNNGEINQFTDPGQGLGPATDYQGSLATAVRLLEEDMLEVGPAVRSRTRYIVVFVSDGVPEPRCLAGCEDNISNCSNGEDDDGDGLIDGADSNCNNINDSNAHPDSLYGVCNTDLEVPEDVYVDMTGRCPEYNQPQQIMQRIQDVLLLKDIYSAGDVALHTVLLFSPQDVVEGICPGASASFGYNHDTAKALLQSMAQAGRGTFRDVNLEYGDQQFLKFDYASLESQQWLSEFTAVNLHARRLQDGTLDADSDMDGLPDSLEFELGTGHFDTDSDNDEELGLPNGDNYSDLFEVVNATEGFDPLDAGLPAVQCAENADFDGDGLSNCEELFLGTNERNPDSDGDLILDRLELVFGTDPLSEDADRDLDFDGVSNRNEIRASTNPSVPDIELWRDKRIRYGLTDLGDKEVPNRDNNIEERHCYEFAATHIELVTTPLTKDRGLNRIMIYTSEKPLLLSGAESRTFAACIEVFYNGETSKDPPDGVVDLTQEAWEAFFDLSPEFNLIAECLDKPRQDLVRDDLLSLIELCQPVKVAVEGTLYKREELEDLVIGALRGNLSSKQPQASAELFVEIENFDPAAHCFRPSDFEIFRSFLVQLAEDCQTCEALQPAAPAEGGGPEVTP